MEALLVSVHALAAALWFGVLFYQRVILPKGLERVEPPQRLAVATGATPRFFAVAFIASALLLISGMGLMSSRGFGPHVQIMFAIWVLMTATAVYAAFGPAKRLRAAAAAGDLDAVPAALKTLRILVTVNVKLAAIAIILGVAGPLILY